MAELPCGVAFDRASDDVAVAERSEGGGFNVRRVGRDALAALITAAEVRTALAGWSAHTDRTQLPFTAADADENILGQLIEAQARDEGTTNLRFTFTRTHGGKVVLTQSLRAEADESVAALRAWLSEQTVTAGPDIRVKLDTAARCVARLWLEGPVSRGEVEEDSTVAVLVVGEDGYGMGLWGTRDGFVYETGERFKPGAADVQLANHVSAKVTGFVSAATVEKLGLHPVRHLVVVTPRLKEHLGGFLHESAQLRGVRIERLLMPAGEGVEEVDLAAAIGMGSLIDSTLVPAADLSADLAAQLAERRKASEALLHAQQATARRLTAFAGLVPLFFLLSFVLASWLARASEARALERSIAEEKATAARLKQANSDYEAAKANFAVIGNLITQITNLRDKQADAYQLLVELNSRWPQGTPWFVSEVNSTGNQIEVKGRTRDEQALTAFVRALENSEGVFTNVTESHNDPNTGSAVGSIPAQPQDGQQKSGTVVQFFVKANYTPRANTPAAAPNLTALTAPQGAKGK